MKIRNGFVSNSSSSSFVCYGTSFPIYGSDQLEEIKNKIIASIKNGFLEVENKEESIKKITEEDSFWEIGDILCSFPKLANNHFSTSTMCGEEWMIGMDFYDILVNDENLTFKEMKKTSKNILTNIFGEETEISYIEEGWMDN